MKLCLIRHGETEENLSRILQGHLPGTLTLHGKTQAAVLRESLDVSTFDAVISSDLKRVTDTVEILLEGVKVPWVASRLFREIDWGSMTGMKIEEVDFKKLAEDVESREMLYERAGQAAEIIKRDYMGKNVLIVSHGLFLRSLIARFMDVPVARLHTIRHLKNCEARWLTVEE